ncbi:lanthionine synthetase C family protein [Pseudonocardia nigra]|uniref:lanthionine synthetase C family protein n=1 Tax=Pseudonocardia nigra TaxID=1921578 RepID=UPI001C5D05CD|nr:lanthionine synthetase C family protein [Pseudonocardia nigra]
MSATPTTRPTTSTTAAHAQSLAQGAAGAALLPIERAHRGEGTWDDAHRALAGCTRQLVADQTASLYFGAPAVAFALHAANAANAANSRYRRALTVLDQRIDELTARRLTLAHARIDRRERARAAEFDLFYGLTGIGAHLLARHPGSPRLREILSYLVRLTASLPGDPDALPGWWCGVGPSGEDSPAFPGGHANLGMAHGIAGPLSLLSLAISANIVVDGHTAAIRHICDWLDHHRQPGPAGAWWPQWITLDEHRAGRVTQPGPLRPSWCYGTPGLARAQQLAAIALGDRARKHMAQNALADCLADPAQRGRIHDAGLCHGLAGLLHTAHRVAADADPDDAGRITSRNCARC